MKVLFSDSESFELDVDGTLTRSDFDENTLEEDEDEGVPSLTESKTKKSYY